MIENNMTPTTDLTAPVGSYEPVSVKTRHWLASLTYCVKLDENARWYWEPVGTQVSEVIQWCSQASVHSLYSVWATRENPNGFKGCDSFPSEIRELITTRKLEELDCISSESKPALNVGAFHSSSELGSGMLTSPTENNGAILSRHEICMS